MFGKAKISPRDLSDEALMLRITNRDRQAFEVLYDRYFGKLVWFAQNYLSQVQQAEDLVQEAFVKIIHKPENFNSNKKFSTWIYTLVANACKNELRNDQNRSRILNENLRPNHSVLPENIVDNALLRTKIQEALKELNEKERSIFTLRFEQELHIKEIAEILDIPEGTVKSGIYYLLKKLSHTLKPFKYES